jgi:hypothetical protein
MDGLCASTIPAMRANELSTLFDDPHFEAVGSSKSEKERRALSGDAAGPEILEIAVFHPARPAHDRRAYRGVLANAD